ncbi:Arabinose operon regulatory protein [Paenibacillus auburnensis]|uniref:Arabinose operon regulatory protein n=1 Tax=Paenibacillus auburnensis TaxID=2905649 RepID=A0ABM9CS60_9BACL|nr:helix-turn-helix domain-containing protein [Paenibacillus auburnensis]CAH1221762.1 Arabinose operon regulatory protein [Paenibacillus auburnensis]
MAKKLMDYAIHAERSYGILIAGHFRVAADYAIHRSSGSRDWLLIYTISGEGQIQLSDGYVTCAEGDVAILLPGMAHHYSTKGADWEMIWVHFIPDPHWSTWLSLPEKEPNFIYHRVSSAEARLSIQNALMRMISHELPGINSLLHRRLSELALEEAIVHVQLDGNAGNQVSMDPRISAILRDLQLNPAQKISLPELAQKSCMSTSRLSHLFKEQVGDTVLNTLNKFRLERAAQLLSGTQRQVAEIAADVGFDCAIHFTRKFRDTFGETPSLYRKRKQSEMKEGADKNIVHD